MEKVENFQFENGCTREQLIAVLLRGLENGGKMNDKILIVMDNNQGCRVKEIFDRNNEITLYNWI